MPNNFSSFSSERIDSSSIESNLHYCENDEPKLLPARMNPLTDELLSSWIMRLAMAHGMKVQSFCSAVLGRNTPVWNRDIDKMAPSKIIEILARRTNVPVERVFQTTLADYEGKIYEKHNSNGNTPWIMPIRIYHRKRKRNGLQMCAFCLSNDIEPYYRREWRLSWITTCLKHKVILLDECPTCKNPITFHRREMGSKKKFNAYSITLCGICNVDWSSKEISLMHKKVDLQVLCFQKLLVQSIEFRWVEIKNFDSVHTILFFKGIYQLLRIISVSNRSKNFRKEINRCINIKLPETTIERTFDYLPIFFRHQAIKGLAWLLENWSERFVQIATESRTWASTLLSDNDQLPFWYKSVVTESLMNKKIGVSEKEIYSAFSILLNRREISIAQLKKLMQNNHIFTKKKLEIKTQILESLDKLKSN